VEGEERDYPVGWAQLTMERRGETGPLLAYKWDLCYRCVTAVREFLKTNPGPLTDTPRPTFADIEKQDQAKPESATGQYLCAPEPPPLIEEKAYIAAVTKSDILTDDDIPF